ncbi:hypothetical protein R1N_42400 [Enterobacter asburiae]|nr:hypothetical protein EAA2563_40930 [Enterobacter asburiae]BCP72053.1 hypothetical protein R1N_42400 [Enterobacter asburiae]
MMSRLLKPHKTTFQLALIECKEPFSLLCCQPGLSDHEHVEVFQLLQSRSRFQHYITTQRPSVY